MVIAVIPESMQVRRLPDLALLMNDSLRFGAGVGSAGGFADLANLFGELAALSLTVLSIPPCFDRHEVTIIVSGTLTILPAVSMHSAAVHKYPSAFGWP
ncbi:hypothetical protein [uncultured Cellulomonas sp.]|uniref:hypothetical protein n=1 Tax=uncultured Cellulomonas sp. TaxID=189682 RepID=UPI00262CE523|nr:hypothetical protein [uncultured Cellulomonas sp.]